MKAILMSIRPQHARDIMNGDKTVELRKRFPKDYRGWVYGYVTKDKKQPLASFRFIEGWQYRIYGDNTYYSAGCTSNIGNDVNGKVAFRFWVDNVEDTIVFNYDTQTQTLTELELSIKSCISIKDLNNNFVDSKAIHISKLEIFDKPKELGEFHYYKKRLIDCGMDCPPYFDEVKTQVRKAPQSWQYVEVEDDNHNQ